MSHRLRPFEESFDCINRVSGILRGVFIFLQNYFVSRLLAFGQVLLLCM